MKLSRQTEEMAKAEGFSDPTIKGGYVVDDYHTSHDACQRVIDGLDSLQKAEYLMFLEDVYAEDCTQTDWETFLVSLAPAQKVEAILKVMGVWEDD